MSSTGRGGSHESLRPCNFPPVKVSGSARPPGDKSISHRALMLAALARGTSDISGWLAGEDVKSTARVLRQLGVAASAVRPDRVSVRGTRLTAPVSRLNCGNSGTTARLMLGILAGQRFAATLTGDRSLRRRPMRRVTEPLRTMGARIEANDHPLPVTILGEPPTPLDSPHPAPSPHAKSPLFS